MAKLDHKKVSYKKWYLAIQPWVIWGLGASFFFAEYFARVAPSVMVPDLMVAFHVSAFGLGALSALFYYPYILMQIPVGSMVDRYGPHRLLTIMAAVCGLGCLIFAFANDMWVAGFGRVLIGFSAAFAFVGTLKLATLWFEPRRLGFIAGLTQGLGMLGALFGEDVFSKLVVTIGWRESLMVMALSLFVVALLIGLLVRDRRSNLLSHGHTKTPLEIRPLEGLKIVFRNPHSWLIACYAGLIYAPTAVIAELWGIHFLESSDGLPRVQAGFLVGFIFAGLAVGCPLIGWLSDRIGLRKPLLLISAFLSLLLICVLLYVHHLPYEVFCLLFFLYGVANSGIALSYAAASELNPLPISGVSIAFTNMASVLLGGALLQPIVGWLLDLRWLGKLDSHGAPVYSTENFHSAFALLPLCLLLACVVAIFVKETRCRTR